MEIIRTCVACRTKDKKENMLKVVKHGENFAVDVRQNADGRGAYVCKCAKCIETAIKKRAFNRTFKCSVPQSLYDEIAKISF